MSKVKFVFWIILLGLLALLVYQNKSYFLSENSLGIDLYFVQKQTPLVPNAILFAIFFLAGWVIAYFFSLFERFKASKTIKGLKSQLTDQHNMLMQLKRSVDARQTASFATGSAAAADETTGADRSDTGPDREPQQASN